ncbi:MAG: alpha/beta hydrolase [Cellvibrio sp.]|uniref:alpha/beta fold hydrolase n=1 Tax=Cellvibrio sp. TaxID=1965322 RepID=UPI0031AB3B81
MIRQIITFSFLLSLSISTSADWLDTVANTVDAALGRTTTNNNSALIPVTAAQFKLPPHWKSYWLENPNLGTRIFLAETGKANAPTIILVHGLGQNGLRDWLSLTPALEQHYRVVMIDLPGFANSPSPQTKLSPTTYADVLHFIKPYFSKTPVTVVGHSMGGAVTLRYAERYPDDIAKIMLIDAAGILQRTAFVKHSATDRIPTGSEQSINPLLTYAIGLQDIGNTIIEKLLSLPDPTSLLGKSNVVWGKTLQNYPNINAALSLIEEDFSAAIFTTQKNVSILWGSNDQIAPLRTAQTLSATLANSNLKIIDGAGHVPMATHAKDVSQWIIEQFNKPITQAKADKITNTPQAYECLQRSGDRLTGNYTRITLNGCTEVTLDGVTANEIIITDSAAAIQNSHFTNPQTSLTITNSSVLATGGSISGLVTVDNSRIDFAGIQFTQNISFNATKKSRLILSVSKTSNGRYLHKDIELENARW